VIGPLGNRAKGGAIAALFLCSAGATMTFEVIGGRAAIA